MKKLINFKNDVYSQFGEDGIIQEIFRVIGAESKKCIEFGAWDGFHYSNTANLWQNFGWEALLVESDFGKYQELIENTKSYNCKCVNKYVENKGSSSICEISKKNEFGPAVDLLCIDIDGDEYHVLENLNYLDPTVICCEYNPTIPPHIEVISNEKAYCGASSFALKKLGESKGYRIVAVTDTNLFMVKEHVFEKFSDFETCFDKLVCNEHLTYLMTDYAGNYFLNHLPPYGIKEPLVIEKKLLVEEAGTRKSFQTKISLAKDKVKKRISFLFKKEEKLPKLVDFGGTLPMPQEYKIKEILRYKDLVQADTLVETGTYLGTTLETCIPHFSNLVSIELGKKLYEAAVEKFKRFENVHLYNGDSGEIMKQLLKKHFDKTTVFWLDGHYSAGITAKGEQHTPIVKELEAIFEFDLGNSVILIDDARCFTGEYDYPTLFELKDSLLEKDENLKIIVKNDIIRVGKSI